MGTPPRNAGWNADCAFGVLAHKRREVTRLRDNREIDDLVLQELQAALDNEEIRLLGRGPNE